MDTRQIGTLAAVAIALLLLAAAVAVAGLALAAIGLRGRRVDAHPHCRRCGYDLAGTPDATVCTECGRDLTAERRHRGHLRGRRGELRRPTRRRPPPGSGRFSVCPGGSTSWSFYFKSLPGRIPTDLPAGPAELSVTVRSTYVVGQHNDVRIRRHHEGTPREYDEFILLPEPHAERKVAARATTRVLAADAPVPTAIAGPRFRDAVHAGVLASQVTQVTQVTQVAQAAWFPGTGLYVRVEADGSPVRVRGMAYVDAELRWRGRDVALDDWPVDLSPSRPYAFQDLRLQDDARDLALRAAEAGEPVALVIRPEVDDALDLIDPEPIWGETLIFPDLPVRDAPQGLRSDRPAEAMRDDERTP